ncbi:MAG: gliding motility-associated C-terminal domain-containing protein [Cyclobacteriaceae bacterium]
MSGDIEVFNGISPGGLNPKLIIQFIDALPETKNNTVSIYDRWENLVWQGSNYDNNSVVFTGISDSGNSLPSGVYFYKIEFTSGKKTQTGFISLRRQ